jgi:hypothetical protein
MFRIYHRMFLMLALFVLSVVSIHATPASAGASYDGDWNGSVNSIDVPISFHVENNQITFVNLGYSVQTGGCSLSGSLSKSVDNGSIASTSFALQLSDDYKKQYTFNGTFGSNMEAKGTLEVKGTSESCGSFDSTNAWAAKEGPADASATPSALGSAPASIPTAGSNPVDVVQSFFDAVNADDIDTAIDLVDDNVAFNIGSTTGVGKDDLRTYLEKQSANSVTYTAGNLQDTAGIVSFSLQTSDSTTATKNNSAIVGDNLIQVLTLH